MNEAETRAELIDPALKEAGWAVVANSRIRREYSISPRRIEGPGKNVNKLSADYILEFRNTRLAVIEAKAVHLEPTEGSPRPKITPPSWQSDSPKRLWLPAAPRCRKSSMPRTATFSMFSPISPTPCRLSPVKSAPPAPERS